MCPRKKCGLVLTENRVLDDMGWLVRIEYSCPKHGAVNPPLVPSGRVTPPKEYIPPR